MASRPRLEIQLEPFRALSIVLSSLAFSAFSVIKRTSPIREGGIVAPRVLGLPIEEVS